MELIHAAAYLPRGLKAFHGLYPKEDAYLFDVVGIDQSKIAVRSQDCAIRLTPTANVLPILYPLSDVKKMLRELKWSIHYYDTVISGNYIDLENISYADTQKLLAKRIDIFGLIGRNEAIDVTTLSTNPYS